MSKNGISEYLCKYMLHTYAQSIVLKTRFPSHALRTKEVILILSSFALKLQLKRFPTVYNMNDLAVIIFGGCYTFKICPYIAENGFT